MLSDKEKEELAKVITSKVKTFECPMCHNHSFTIIDGYLIQNLQNSINSYVIGNEPIIPSIAIVIIVVSCLNIIWVYWGC